MDIDVIFSHTCPIEFQHDYLKCPKKMADPSRMALSFLLNKYKPKEWYFGHYHEGCSGTHTFYDNTVCQWYCVGMIPLDEMKPQDDWWMILD
jgi:hypothetical protein